MILISSGNFVVQLNGVDFTKTGDRCSVFNFYL